MPRIEGEPLIERPVEDVFDFVADERNEPYFNPRMLHAEKVSTGPIRVGTRFTRGDGDGTGTPTAMTIEVTAFERPRRLASITRLSSMEIRGGLVFDPVPEGTRMRRLWDVQSRGFLRLLGPVVGWMGRRQERAIWTNLKCLLEVREGLHGG